LLEARDSGNYSKIPVSAAHLDLVAACNYNCGLCIEKEIRKKNCRLSYPKARSILRDLEGLNCRDLSFYGGEPTLHPKFIEITKYATELGFRPLVVTNGSKLTEGRIAEGLKKLAGKVRLRVSMDANSPATYARHHGLRDEKYRFERIRDAVCELAHHLDVSVSFLLTKDNVNELTTAMDFWKGSRVTSFNPRMPMGKHGCWLLTDKHSKSLRRKLKSIPWKRYPPNWLIVPDWLHDWIQDGSKPNALWAFSRCYSAFYRVGISPGLDTTPEQTDPAGAPIETNDAWLSLCPYHRYDRSYGCKYPRSLVDWCGESRAVAVDRIRPYWCETVDKVVCSRVAHNTAVQVEINRY
jgi:organic radical activating enzyme